MYSVSSSSSSSASSSTRPHFRISNPIDPRIQAAAQPVFISITHQGKTVVVSTDPSDLSSELHPVMCIEDSTERNAIFEKIVEELTFKNPEKALSIALLIDEQSSKNRSLLAAARKMYIQTRRIESSLIFLNELNDPGQKDLFFSWAIGCLTSSNFTKTKLDQALNLAHRCHCSIKKDELFFSIAIQFAKTTIDSSTLDAAFLIANPAKKASCLKELIDLLKIKIEDPQLLNKKAAHVSLALQATSHINDPSEPHARTYLFAQICTDPPFGHDTLFENLNNDDKEQAYVSLEKARNTLDREQYDLFIEGVSEVLNAQISDCDNNPYFFTVFNTLPTCQKTLFFELVGLFRKRPPPSSERDTGVVKHYIKKLLTQEV